MDVLVRPSLAGADLAWGQGGLKPPYPQKLHEKYRQEGGRRRGKKGGRKKKGGAGGRRREMSPPKEQILDPPLGTGKGKFTAGILAELVGVR